jgi:hypothetical protein
MWNQKIFRALVTMALVGAMSGCSGQTSSSGVGGGGSPQPMGNVFSLATDNPSLPQVVGFKINVTGLTLSDGITTANLLTAQQTVDFSRLNGLNTLLDLNAVPAGTYNKVNITLSSPVISFIDTAANPPVVNTINGNLLQSSVTVTLAQPLVLSQNDLVGLLIDLRIGDSLVIQNGQITGDVNPTFRIKAIAPDAPDASIDDLRAGVVSVNAAGGTFVIQGPRGRQFTVTTNNQTDFENGGSLNDLDTNTIVDVSGSLDRATLNIKADEVQIVSKERFVLGGLITDVRPSPGSANQMDVFVRTELPDLSGAPIGQIDTLNLTGNELYQIRYLRLPISVFLFNRSSLVRGQRVAVGGALSSSNPPVMTVKRVVLQWQGIEGGWVPGSTVVQTGNVGSFSLNGLSLAGTLFGGPVRVLTSNQTRFINLSGLSGLSGAQAIPLRVVGLVLLDHASGKPAIVAGKVEKLQ